MEENKDMVLIRVERKTRDALKRFGIKGDTFNDIIQKLMEEKIKGAEDQ